MTLEQSDDPVNASLRFFAVKANAPHKPISTIPQLAAAVATLTKQEGRALTTVQLPHSVHSVHSVADGWLRSRPENSPTHEVELSVDKSSYSDLGLSLPNIGLRNRPSKRVDTLGVGVFDTGAQSHS